MQAIVQDRFGRPDVLKLREIDQPDVGDDEVLVRVRAASENPADWYAMAGFPTSHAPRGAADAEGRAGPGRRGRGGGRRRAGDALQGGRRGVRRGLTLAEYAAVPEDALVAKPATCRLSRPPPSPWPASPTALQGLRDKGGIRPGQRA